MRTSDICQSMDGKEFNLEDADVGENYPPMHPNCRSVVSPVDDRANRSKGTRSARNPVTGKTIKVPANMTYQDWHKQFVEGKEKQIATPKKYISKSDREQYKRYVDILGENAPKNLDNFVNIKYNNNEKWNYLKSLVNSKNYLQNQLSYIYNGKKCFIPIHTRFNSTPKVIAGNGAKEKIRVVDKITAKYGGNEDSWSKKVAKIKSDKYTFDIHWYENNGIQYDTKVKNRKENNIET